VVSIYPARIPTATRLSLSHVHSQPPGIFGTHQRPVNEPITLILIAASALLSIVAFGDRRLFNALLFEPFVIRARGDWYRFVTHAFIHANWPHLLVNMFVLYMFGRNVEVLLPMISEGSVVLNYLLLYFGGIIFSTLPSYQRNIHDPSYRAVGASGAVSAVLFAQILMLPTSPVVMFFFPVPMPAWVFGLLYLAYSYYMDKRGGDNVAHDAHFFGAIYGILFMVFLDPGLVLDLGGFQRSIGM
jgi:membrane associated rhomboid family serine protease